MSIINRAGRNIFFKTLAEILSRLIYLFFFVYMARKLGTNDFGLFSFAFSFAGIFVIIIDPGLNVLLTRDVSRDHALSAKYNSNVLTIKTLLSIVTFFMIWAVIKLLGYDNHTISVVLSMGIFLILNCFLDFLVSIADAYERMEIDAAIKITNKFFVSVLGTAALLAGSKIIGMISGMVAGSAIAVLAGYYLVKNVKTSIKIKFDWSFLKTIVHNALPIALTMIFAIIYFKVDVVMLSMFKVSNSQIGLYSAAIKLIEILNVIPAIFVSAIFPILAGFSEELKSELELTIKRAYRFLLLIAVPIVVTIAIRSKDVVSAIYGDDYAGSSIALKILILTSLFIFPNFLLSNMIIVVNRQKLNAIFAFVCLLLNVGLNIFLIPRYGFVGAGIATVLTDMLFFIFCAVFVVKYFKSGSLLRDSLKLAVCGVLLAIVLISLNALSFIFIPPIVVISYLLLILITKAVSVDDLIHIKRAFVRS